MNLITMALLCLVTFCFVVSMGLWLDGRERKRSIKRENRYKRMKDPLL